MGPIAVAILNDAGRLFASSVYVSLEVLPKAVYYGRTAEVSFYEAYFASVSLWAAASVNLIEEAAEEARRYGLAAMDALHVAAARQTGAAELITTERPTSPLRRVAGLTITSIHPSAPVSR